MHVYGRLREIYKEMKAHTDMSYKSIPLYVAWMAEIKVELLKVSSEQAEQLSRDVMDATRFMAITQREDLNNIANYPREIPKYLGRVKTAVMTHLAFINK